MSMIKMTKLTKPRRDKEGKLIYRTEQAHRDAVNVNNIIKKYARTGTIEHIKYVEPSYIDTTGADFKTSLDKVIKIQQKFEEIPANIRKRFDHDPEKFLNFFNDEKNKEEAVKIGLTRSDWKIEPEPSPLPDKTAGKTAPTPEPAKQPAKQPA